MGWWLKSKAAVLGEIFDYENNKLLGQDLVMGLINYQGENLKIAVISYLL